jgi:uncharacterized spore protein YtfJ
MVQLRRDLFKNADTYVKEFLQKETVLAERVRKDRSDIIDVKQFVKDLGLETRADFQCLRVEISLGGQGSCSAAEVAQAVLHLSPDEAKCLHITRTETRFGDRPLRKIVDAKEHEEEGKKE